jgi:hypothetical protein
MLALATSTKPAAMRRALEREGESVRLHAAERQVHVGECELAGAGAPVTQRSGQGARALRADRQAEAVETTQRAPAGRHRVDAQHRRLDPHAAHSRLEAALHLTVLDEGDVRRGAAHVEAHGAREARRGGDPRGAHHATRGPREQCGGAAEALAVGEAARGLHEAQLRAGQRALQRIHVAAQQRRQVGVDAGRLAARQEPALACHLVGDRDVLEPHLAGHRAQPALDVGMRVGVDQRDRGRPAPPAPGPYQGFSRRRLVEGCQAATVDRHASRHLDHVAVQGRRLDDAQVEQVGTLLGADGQHVAEGAVGDQQRGHTTPLEQCVGRHRSAELDATARQRLARFQLTRALQDPTDALERCLVLQSVKVPPRSIQNSQVTVRRAASLAAASHRSGAHPRRASR